ncbi:SMAD/FHA domain-containing protein [Dentipellis sp. KUC8613]|nr:SMAD/FHA domain-containing protein [Dentipellis sp. KUC8613]
MIKREEGSRSSRRRDYDSDRDRDRARDYDRGKDDGRRDGRRDRDSGYRRRDDRDKGADRDRERERDSRRYGRDNDDERSRRPRDRDTDRRREADDERPHYRDNRNRDRPRERSRDRDRDRRGGSSRRSASPPSRRPRSPSQAEGSAPPEDKAKPNFGASGLLAAETNTVRKVDGTSTVLKYNEPPEARKPVVGWRLYVFKGSEQVDMLHIHRQSAYLIGRDRVVADIAIEHPSCSKQHAVIQFRYVQTKDEFGVSKGTVKPFIIDLESTNGTFVNDEKIPTTRFYELKATDVLKFGQSTREYVLLQDDAS